MRYCIAVSCRGSLRNVGLQEEKTHMRRGNRRGQAKKLCIPSCVISTCRKIQGGSRPIPGSSTVPLEQHRENLGSRMVNPLTRSSIQCNAPQCSHGTVHPARIWGGLRDELQRSSCLRHLDRSGRATGTAFMSGGDVGGNTPGKR